MRKYICVEMSHLGNLEHTRIEHAFAHAGPCYLECTAACYSQLRFPRLFHMQFSMEIVIIFNSFYTS